MKLLLILALALPLLAKEHERDRDIDKTPEPATWALMAAGIAVGAWFRRKGRG